MSAKSEVLELLKRPSDRDQQRLVGASNLSNMCTYCLARDMLSTFDTEWEPTPSRYWMGARIGTAIHETLEKEILARRPETQPEYRVTLGEIPGYGLIKSTTDWYVEPDARDFKTTTKAKLPHIKDALTLEPSPYDLSKVIEARHKVAGYKNQLDLYGMGLENAGLRVETCTIIFICRDGSNDNDIWDWTQEYSRERAEIVWNRAVKLWQYLEDGGSIENLKSAEACYPCNVEGRV